MAYFITMQIFHVTPNHENEFAQNFRCKYVNLCAVAKTVFYARFLCYAFKFYIQNKIMFNLDTNNTMKLKRKLFQKSVCMRMFSIFLFGNGKKNSTSWVKVAFVWFGLFVWICKIVAMHWLQIILLILIFVDYN